MHYLLKGWRWFRARKPSEALVAGLVAWFVFILVVRVVSAPFHATPERVALATPLALPVPKPEPKPEPVVERARYREVIQPQPPPEPEPEKWHCLFCDWSDRMPCQPDPNKPLYNLTTCKR